jgi:hypothetical protein
MDERLMEKLARLGAEAGIKQMTPEIYKFSWLLNEDKNKIWDEWVKKRLEEKRPWVGLTEEEIDDIFWQHESRTEHQVPIYPYERAIEAKLKEKNNV